MRVATFNLCAMPNHGNIRDLARLLGEHEPDIALLQECLPSWVAAVRQETGLEIVHAHSVPPEVPARDFPPDGCAIGVRQPLGIERAWRVPPKRFYPEPVRGRVGQAHDEPEIEMPRRLADRYSCRSLLAELSVNGRRFVAASLHGTPGTGQIGPERVGPRKSFYPAGVATALAELDLPFVFGIDANEPETETLDEARFHWGEAHTPRIAALLDPVKRIHRGRDLLREWIRSGQTAPEADGYLALTYTTRGGQPRRFDHLWATDDFALRHFATFYEEALAVGGDHALVIADLALS